MKSVILIDLLPLVRFYHPQSSAGKERLDSGSVFAKRYSVQSWRRSNWDFLGHISFLFDLPVYAALDASNDESRCEEFRIYHLW